MIPSPTTLPTPLISCHVLFSHITSTSLLSFLQRPPCVAAHAPPTLTPLLQPTAAPLTPSRGHSPPMLPLSQRSRSSDAPCHRLRPSHLAPCLRSCLSTPLYAPCHRPRPSYDPSSLRRPLPPPASFPNPSIVHPAPLVTAPAPPPPFYSPPTPLLRPRPSYASCHLRLRPGGSRPGMTPSSCPRQARPPFRTSRLLPLAPPHLRTPAPPPPRPPAPLLPRSPSPPHPHPPLPVSCLLSPVSCLLQAAHGFLKYAYRLRQVKCDLLTPTPPRPSPCGR